MTKRHELESEPSHSGEA